MIKYFIRHYWRYLAMALAFATISFFINSCEVHAENLIVPNTFEIKYQKTQGGSYYNANFNATDVVQSGSNYYLMVQGTLFPQNFDNTNGDMTGTNLYGRHTICSRGAFTNGWNSFNTTDVLFINTQIPCNFTGTYSDRGVITYATFKFTSIDLQSHSIDVYSEIGTNAQSTSTIQYISFEYSFSPFDTYYPQAMIFDKLTGVQQGIVDTIAYQVQLSIQNNNNNLTYIINNNNYNTDRIITNQNSNTDRIIANDNVNNQALIDKANEILEQTKVCDVIDRNDIIENGKYFRTNGEIGDTTYYGITDYIYVYGANVEIKTPFTTTNSGVSVCYYSKTKSLISCQNLYNLTNLTIPQNAYYMRSTIFNYNQNNVPVYNVCMKGNQAISNNQNQIIQGQNEINQNITDSSTDDPSNDISDMHDNEISNSVISDLLLLPINMFQNILNAVNGSCSAFSLGALFGTNLVLPCINLESLLGSTLWGVIDVLFCGIFVLSIRKKFVDIFQNITSLKDRGNELE